MGTVIEGGWRTRITERAVDEDVAVGGAPHVDARGIRGASGRVDASRPRSALAVHKRQIPKLHVRGPQAYWYRAAPHACAIHPCMRGPQAYWYRAAYIYARSSGACVCAATMHSRWMCVRQRHKGSRMRRGHGRCGLQRAAKRIGREAVD